MPCSRAGRRSRQSTACCWSIPNTSSAWTRQGTLTLIDEIHTPDSSRYWKLDIYAARLAKGEEPEYFDKEFLRIWFREHCDPYKDKVLPEAPADMVAELSRRYIEIYEQLTGQKFAVDLSAPPWSGSARIWRNTAAVTR